MARSYLHTSHANLFIPVLKLPYTYFPLFLLRIPEIQYAKKKHLHVTVRVFWNCFATQYY